MENNSIMNPTPKELEKSKSHIIVEIIEHIPNAVVSRTIINKNTGSITATSLDAGEGLAEKVTPYDTYIQIIEGAAEITIGGKKFLLKLGEGIIIPARTVHKFHATQQFKMIATTIEGQYEA